MSLFSVVMEYIVFVFVGVNVLSDNFFNVCVSIIFQSVNGFPQYIKTFTLMIYNILIDTKCAHKKYKFSSKYEYLLII